jgi:hypothetical protein
LGLQPVLGVEGNGVGFTQAQEGERCSSWKHPATTPSPIKDASAVWSSWRPRQQNTLTMVTALLGERGRAVPCVSAPLCSKVHNREARRKKDEEKKNRRQKKPTRIWFMRWLGLDFRFFPFLSLWATRTMEVEGPDGAEAAASPPSQSDGTPPSSFSLAAPPPVLEPLRPYLASQLPASSTGAASPQPPLRCKRLPDGQAVWFRPREGASQPHHVQPQPTPRSGATRPRLVSPAATKELQQKLAALKERHRKLKLVERYRERTDFDTLPSLTARWKEVVQRSLEDLRDLSAETTGTRTDIKSLLAHFHIDPAFVGYREEEDGF